MDGNAKKKVFENRPRPRGKIPSGFNGNVLKENTVIS
jgi:hypothetical protein